MTYVASTDAIDECLENKFNEIVTPKFQKKLENMAIKAAEEYGYELQSQLSFMLEDGQLSGSIRNAAQRMAENFIESVQAGNDDAVEQFFGTPNNPYVDERSRIRPDESPRYGGIALRRALIEAVQDRLENEVIKDQAAEIEAIRTAYLKANAELWKWRCGEQLHPLKHAVREFLATTDFEESCIFIGQDAGCPECTANTVPYDRTTGPCAWHRLLSALEAAE